MRKQLLLCLALMAVVAWLGCNKQKPYQLNYAKEGKEQLYDPQGLPGEGHIGSTPVDQKFHGYKPTDESTPAPEKIEPQKPEEPKVPSSNEQPSNTSTPQDTQTPSQS